MPKEYISYLKTILQECKDIETLKENGLQFEILVNDFEKKKTVLFSIQNIGEYAYKNPLEQKLKWDEVEWIKIVGIRNRIAHDYLGVDLNIVWKIIKYDIPKVIVQIENILDRENRV